MTRGGQLTGTHGTTGGWHRRRGVQGPGGQVCTRPLGCGSRDHRDTRQTTSSGPATRLETRRQEGSGSARTHHTTGDRQGRDLPGPTRRPGCIPGGLSHAPGVLLPLWGGPGDKHGHGLTREWGAGPPRPRQRRRVSVTKGPSGPVDSVAARQGRAGRRLAARASSPASESSRELGLLLARGPPAPGAPRAGSGPRGPQVPWRPPQRHERNVFIRGVPLAGIAGRLPAARAARPRWPGARAVGTGSQTQRWQQQPEARARGSGQPGRPTHGAWVVPSSACSGQRGDHGPNLPERDAHCRRLLSQTGRERSVHTSLTTQVCSPARRDGAGTYRWPRDGPLMYFSSAVL